MPLRVAPGGWLGAASCVPGSQDASGGPQVTAKLTANRSH
jgi:hypothetical protein